MDRTKKYKYGVILGLLLFIYFLITNFLQVSGQEFFGWLGYILYPIILVKVILNNSTLKGFLMVFKTGMVIVIIGALLNAVIMFLYLQYISDFMIQNTLSIQRIEMIENNVDAATIETRIAALEAKVTPSFFLVFAFISGSVIGIFSSAIVGLLRIKK